MAHVTESKLCNTSQHMKDTDSNPRQSRLRFWDFRYWNAVVTKDMMKKSSTFMFSNTSKEASVCRTANWNSVAAVLETNLHFSGKKSTKCLHSYVVGEGKVYFLPQPRKNTTAENLLLIVSALAILPWGHGHLKQMKKEQFWGKG